MKRSPRFDTPVACALILIVALSLFTVVQLAPARFDPSAFIVAGDRYSDATRVPAGVAVLKDSNGYDGQFYYRLALQPFTSQATEFGITLDNPPYRHQRLLYPSIVHVVALGDARWTPFAMIATNFLFFGLLAWIAGSLARTYGRHALWGLLFVCNPGFLITYSRDLVEIVEVAFLLGSFLLVRRRRPTWAAAALTLAVLTRETSLIVAIAAALVFVVERLRGRDPPFGWSYFTIPMLACGTLQVALYLNWGQFPARAGSAVLGALPLAGFTASLSNASAPPSVRAIEIAALGFVVLASLCVSYHLFITRAGLTERLALALYGLLMTSVGALVWAEDIGFLRVFTHVFVLGAIVVVASPANAVGRLFAVSAFAMCSLEAVRLGSVIGIKHLLALVAGHV